MSFHRAVLYTTVRITFLSAVLMSLPASLLYADELNLAPDCSAAYAAPGQLWPVNHKFNRINILGVQDPEGQSIDIVTQCIIQDEAINGKGDGHTGVAVPAPGTGPSSGHAEHWSGDASRDGHANMDGHTGIDPKGPGTSSSSAHTEQWSGDANGDSHIGVGAPGSGTNSSPAHAEQWNAHSEQQGSHGNAGGYTGYDAVGLGTSSPSVRAERQGGGDGRIYQLIFEATDSGGASCVGQISVGVPRKKNSTAVDSGLRVESARGGSNCSGQPTNNPPVIYSTAPLAGGAESILYQYQLLGHDPDQNTLTYNLDSGPAGMVVDPASGLLQWTPGYDEAGSYSIDVSVSDGADSYSQSYTLVIENTNRAPLGESQSLSVDEDSLVTLSLSGIDEDGDAFAVSYPTTPLNGTLTGDFPDLIYTPNPNYFGADSFSYQLSDADASSDTFIISLTVSPVNDAPLASAQNLQTNEDTPIDFVLTGSDPEGGALSFSLVEVPALGLLTGSIPNLTYTPNENASGADSLTFIANDGELGSELTTIEIDIQPINDAPTAADLSLVTDEDTELAISLLGADADNDLLTYEVVDAPANGSLTGTAPNLIYIPNNNQNGPDSFTYKTNDGLLDSPLATVSLEINAINDAPVGSTASYSLDEDGSVSILLLAEDIDSDTLNTPLIFTLLSTPAQGQLTGTAPDLVYTPNENYFGEDSFAFSVSDGELESTVVGIEITVDPVNDAPLIVSTPLLELVASQDYLYQIEVEDVDDILFTYSLEGAPSGMTLDADGLLHWPADQLISGSFSVLVRVLDSAAAVATQLLELEVLLNGPPVITSDAITGATAGENYQYQVLAEDPDADLLSYSLLSAPTGMSIDPITGNISWLPGESDTTSSVSGETEARGCADQCELFSLRYDDPDLREVLPTIIGWKHNTWRWQVDDIFGASDLYLGTHMWANYTYDVEMSVDANNFRPTILRFHGQADGGRMELYVYSRLAVLYYVRAGGSRFTRQTVGFEQHSENMQSYRIELRGYTAKVYVDDVLIIEDNTLPYGSGYAGLGANTNALSLLSLEIYEQDPAPIAGDAYEVQVEVTDSSGLTAIQTYALDVAEQNIRPSINSTPVVSVELESTYQYEVHAFDPNFADTLSLSLSQAPAGMQLVGSTLQWQPTAVGSYPVSIVVTDSQSVSATQQFDLNVYAAGQGSVEIVSEPLLSVINGDAYSYDVEAEHPNGTFLRHRLDLARADMAIDTSSGLVNWAVDAKYAESTEADDHGCLIPEVISPENIDPASWSVIHLPGSSAGAAQWPVTDSVALILGNSPPSILLSDILPGEGRFEIKTVANAGDNDTFGFVWGYQDPQNYYRLTWSQGQGNPQPAYPQVTKVAAPQPSFDGLHPTDVELIARPNVGPWVRYAEYRFILDIRTDVVFIQIYRDDALIDSFEVVDGEGMQQGYLGFFAFSQSDTSYSIRNLAASTDPQLLPDLRAGQLRLANQNAEDQVSVQVRNRGLVDITDDISVKLYARRSWQTDWSELLETKTIEGLDQLQTELIEFSAFSERLDIDEFYVVADEENQLLECHDNNNVAYAPVIDINAIASDGTYDSSYDKQHFAIQVKNQNLAPVIGSSPTLIALAEQPYAYFFTAEDSNAGDRIRLELIDAPAEVEFDADTGQLSWVADASYAGSEVEIVLRAYDLAGLYAEQSFQLSVHRAPEISSSPQTYARVGELYQYQVLASDGDGDALSISLVFGPSGMSMESNGLLSWTPAAGQTGDVSVVLDVSDGRGGVDRQSYSIYVFAVDEINTAPQILSIPATSVVTGDTYFYQLITTDADGNSLSYSLVGAPVGMSFNSTGLMQWTTSDADLGVYSLEISVDDGRGGVSTQSFELLVKEPNQAPVIEPILDQTTEESQFFSNQVLATDPEGLALSYSLSNAPTGMSINGSGLISWQPIVGDAGDYIVGVTVTDDEGLSDSTSFNLSVAVRTSNELPEISSTAFTDAVVGGAYTYLIVATDADGDSLTYSLVSGPTSMTINGNLVSWTPELADLGTQPVSIAVDDGFASVQQNWTLTVVETNDGPSIVIESLEDGVSITAPTDLIGSVTDSNLNQWSVLLKSASAASTAWQTIGSGSSEANSEILAIIDPSLLLNGQYDLAIIASDTLGTETQEGFSFVVEGDLKVGNFSFTIEDLNIPMAGLPISVTRTYDTRRKSESLDFGQGWSVGYQDVRVEESRDPGLGWELLEFPSGPMDIFTTYCVEPLGAPEVSVTLSTGDVERFEVAASPQCNEIIPVLDVSLAFNPVGDNQSTLEALDDDQGHYQLGNLVETNTFADPINPSRYLLTTRTGYQYLLDQDFGVEVITDPNGYTLTFSDSGIVHSAGTSIDFVRDTENRITQVIDPTGMAIDYAYDSAGDLISVTERDGAITSQSYYGQNCDDSLLASADCHLLDELIDPLGRSMVKNIYDDDGRLIAQEDQNGNRTEFNHDLAGRQSIVTDRNGNSSFLYYDDRGNLTSQVDALGNIRSFSYDSQDNQLSQTDELGNTSSASYDSRNDQLSQTDELGNSLTYVYNSRGQETEITDARGNLFANTYDVVGNLLSVTDPNGNIAGNNINAQGLVSSTVDVLGNSTSFTYDSEGNRLTETDALGTVSSFTYDDNNNALTETRTRSGGGSVLSETTGYLYDSRDRVIQTTDALGQIISAEYDLAGNLISQTDALGRSTAMAYDVYGNLLTTSYADGTTDTNSYDPENNLISSTDRLGRTTGYEYDALDRQTQITYPDGTSTETEYDAVGRVSAEIDQRGNRTNHEYDAAGRRTATEDALGNRHSFGYDADGNLTSETDARGNSTTYTYNSLDQRSQTTYADGTSSTDVFDALGRRTAMTDQGGKTTDFDYDALGRLTKVTDALGQETSYSYDEQGNKLSQTDAAGKATNWTYDALGRVTSRTLPLGQTETMVYDANGNMTSHTDFNGNTHAYSYDINDRVSQIDYADGSAETFGYDDIGNRLSAQITDTDGTRIWSYAYDNRDRLTEETKPDGSTLSYGYDDAGNKISLSVSSAASSYSESYTYDNLNRLEQVTDRNGMVTTYSYDAVGNRSTTTNGNATRAIYTYDSLNRLTNLSHQTGLGVELLDYSYTLAPTGRRTQITEANGRVTDYSYDDLYRLTAETVTDALNGNYSANYTYGLTGNRTQETVNGITTAYSYDDNDRLTQTGGTSYSYDNQGNTLTEQDGGNTILYRYNSQNELIERTEAAITTDYQYSADGIRTQNGATGYLVDLNRDYAQVLVEIDTGVEVVSYTYGDDLLNQTRSAITTYYHYDGLGSTRGLTDSSATLTDSYDYEAFGESLNTVGSTENSYLYTGEQYDANQNQYYLRARYYNQSVGRFTQMDTWMGSNQDPVTLHKYLYANADPVSNVDPSGNFSLSSLTTAQKIGVALTAASVGATAFDLTSLVIGGDTDLTPSAVGATIILGLVGNKILKPIAALCKSKGSKTNRCMVAVAYVEAQVKMRNMVSRTPNSRLNSKNSGTFTVSVVSPVIDVKRGRGTAAFNGPINSVIKSSQLRTHAAKFGIYIGQQGACNTRNTVGRCAEWRAANLLLKSGSKIKNLRWFPAHRVRKGPGGFAQLGPIVPPCGICQTF